MAMMRKTITIPNDMEDWVKSQVGAGRYGTDSEYFRDLIRRDQEKQTKIAELQRLITEGIESGVSDLSMREILEAARRKAGVSKPENEL